MIIEQLKAEIARLNAEVERLNAECNGLIKGAESDVAYYKAEVVRLNQETIRLAREAGYVQMTFITTPDQAKRFQERIDLWASCEDKQTKEGKQP